MASRVTSSSRVVVAEPPLDDDAPPDDDSPTTATAEAIFNVIDRCERFVDHESDGETSKGPFAASDGLVLLLGDATSHAALIAALQPEATVYHCPWRNESPAEHLPGAVLTAAVVADPAAPTQRRALTLLSMPPSLLLPSPGDETLADNDATVDNDAAALAAFGVEYAASRLLQRHSSPATRLRGVCVTVAYPTLL
eukprot:gene19058-13753_t